MKEPYFMELDPTAFTEKTIILDIDGTLVRDGGNSIDERVLRVVRRYAEHNTVYLHSNKALPERNRLFARMLGVLSLQSPHKKPSSKIIENIPPERRNGFIVIGDKYLTDGILAKKLRGQFVKVKHITGPREKPRVRLAYLLDNVVFRLLKLIW